MKLVLISDSHAGARNDSILFNNYFLRFYKEVLFPYMDENKLDTIVHLGDLFDRRKYVNFFTLYSWRKNVFEPINKKYEMYIIQGNHDIYFKDSNEVNSLDELFIGYDNIHVIDKPIEKTFDGTDILMIPWIHRSNEEQCMEKMESSRSSILMGHFEILGFSMYKGMMNKDNGYDPAIFSRFEHVMSGHYHHRSTLHNITYLGSPYEIIWTDYRDPRGFHVFDTDTRELEFIENPLKIFYKINYNDVDKVYEDFVVQNEDGTNLSKFKDSYIKVVVKNKTNQNLFDQFIEALHKENPADVAIIESVADADLDPDSIDETKDTLTLLLEYIDTIGIVDENKQSLIELLRKIYMESQNIDV